MNSKKFTFVLLAALMTGTSSLHAWGLLHDTITQASFSVLPEELKQRWSVTVYDDISKKDGPIFRHLIGSFCHYPDYYDCTPALPGFIPEVGKYLYVAGDPRPYHSYHYFLYDEGRNRKICREGAEWYFQRIAENFKAGKPLDAARYAGAFAHVIEDRTAPYHCLDGYEKIRTEYEKKYGITFAFWTLPDSDVKLSIEGYHAENLGTTPAEAAREFTKRFEGINQKSRALLETKFIAAHLEDDWQNKKCGQKTNDAMREMAELAAKLVADVWLTGFTLAKDGRAVTAIVLAKDAALAERTAATELAAYLQKISGAEFAIADEEAAPAVGPCIFVGPAAAARQAIPDFDKLGPEEWCILTSGGNLILAGGRPRGTLYAVYHLLEDQFGVHWWNPWEETVPRQPVIEIGDLNLRGKPTFRYRDIYKFYVADGGRFAARNRVNGDAEAPISAEFGGGMDYGPPSHVHTFYLYIPPARYFGEHPEWFSLVDGKRVAGDGNQLCLTNKELRRVFLGKLREYIRTSRAAAEARGAPPPQVFDISPNDGNDGKRQCQCDACHAMAQAEGSEAGVLLDFVNSMADGIRDEYPDVFIDTLAYQYTKQTPKTVKPRDNVIVRLCDTDGNFTKPITHPDNEAFRGRLLRWAAIAKNLRIWDYAVTYLHRLSAPGLPMPTVHTYPVDYQFYAEHHVEGVFTEHEYPVMADLRDFKVWMMIKLKEDPYQDYDALVRTFTDGFYGPAGEYVREYLSLLEAAAERRNGDVSMYARAADMRYLDLDLIRKAHAIFDRAELALRGVGHRPELLPRLRHARLPLDRATVILWFPRLVSDWAGAGNLPETIPLDRDAIAARARDTWHAVIDRRVTPDRQERERKAAETELARYTAVPARVPLPERFKDLPQGAVFDFPAHLTLNHKDIVKLVSDPEAETGVTNRLGFPTTVDTDRHPLESYKLPMLLGLHDEANASPKDEWWIRPQDVPGSGYHWYRVGTFALGSRPRGLRVSTGVPPTCYVWFFKSWIIQLDVDAVLTPDTPDQRFDFWARIKFEGPVFPHGKPADANAISVERVVLVKAGASRQSMTESP